ncbi:FAD-dependent oxidoreductase [Streptomyces microflavus]|uniref:FAD-dependent oxidoreductase n=1 Tax=Streptomyces microflavus TaxID=1919 RepID=UPI003801A4D0
MAASAFTVRLPGPRRAGSRANRRTPPKVPARARPPDAQPQGAALAPRGDPAGHRRPAQEAGGPPRDRPRPGKVFHFPRLDPSAPPWPSIVHEFGDGIYHLQGGRDGGPGDERKIGAHYGGRAATADRRSGAVDPAARGAMADYIRRWMRGCEATPRGEANCLYTSTPTKDFLLDRVGPIVVCSPCSGHGAKFGPLIGELAVDLVTGADILPERFRPASHLSVGA